MMKCGSYPLLLLLVSLSCLTSSITHGFVVVGLSSSSSRCCQWHRTPTRVICRLKSTTISSTDDDAYLTTSVPDEYDSSEELSVNAPPGEVENTKFQCDDSVRYWRQFESQGNDGNIRAIRQVLANNLLLRNNNNSSNSNGRSSTATTFATAYWSSQLFRTSYFVLTAALGTIGSDLYERVLSSNSNNPRSSDQASSSSSSAAAATFLNINSGGMTSNLLESDVPTRLLLEALKVYEQDYTYVKSGLLNFPWDALLLAKKEAAAGGGNYGAATTTLSLQLDHKQVNPFFVLSETGRVIRESMAIFRRRNKYGGQPSRDQLWLANDNGRSGSDTVMMTTTYPNYYLNDFHYQTDGWLSSESAKTYEVSTETLFLGRQDAMQRQTLIPLLKHYKSSAVPPRSILEVAAGTGRFATFVRDNFPNANMTITDLSPFYLEKARDNDKYWRRYRGEKALKEWSGFNHVHIDTSSTVPQPATFVQANAESLPFTDNSFDAVTCVYLFHELPLDARRNAAREMARVVRPGGIVSFSDSIQLGDRPPLDEKMGTFSRLNEPHYEDYVRTSMAPMFERHGLVCSEKYITSSTKTLSFVKPND